MCVKCYAEFVDGFLSYAFIKSTSTWTETLRNVHRQREETETQQVLTLAMLTAGEPTFVCNPSQRMSEYSSRDGDL